MKIEIRLLSKADDTNFFDCGTVELNQFLKQFAKQNQFKHYIGVTYVALVDNEIIGYVSVSSNSIRIDELSSTDTKHLPRYPLPILRLTRLAIHNEYQNKGIGTVLLKFVLKLTLEQKEKFGCFGLLVDAKEDSVSFYEQFGLKPFSPTSGNLDIRPYAKSLFMTTRVIEKGL